jgi:outer membrane protein OmpA-like peptidoglycan-associated protein
MKRAVSVLVVTLALLLTGCPFVRDEGPLTELEERARSYDSTAERLTDDTEDDQLANYLRQIREEEETLGATIARLAEQQRIDAGQAKALEDTHKELRSLRIKKKRAILDAYNEHIIDFVELNRWKLLPAAIRQLSAIDWQAHCGSGRKLVVYGYGDPIGGAETTRKISDGRAHSVAQWIQANTACGEDELVVRGLGIDVKAEEIQEANLPAAEKQRLYQRSRYARILIPKAGDAGQ